MKVFIRSLTDKGKFERCQLDSSNITAIEIRCSEGTFIIKDFGSGQLDIRTNNGRLVVEPLASNAIQVSELRE